MDMKAIDAQDGRHQGRTLLLAYGWQLCLVANEHQSAVATIIHKADQVVQQATSLTIQTDHRGLIDDEQRIVGIVIAQLEATLQRLLTIDAAMNGIRRTTCIQRKHLGSTSRWCHQHQLLLQRLQGSHDSCCQRRLTRTCRTSHYHHGMLMTIGHECRKDIYGLLLLSCRLETESTPYAIFQLVSNH